MQAEFDDDCATDDDMKDNAIRILQRDLRNSIEKFKHDKKLVKNLNLKTTLSFKHMSQIQKTHCGKQ